MIGSANINQKWSMCQVSPENRRKRRSSRKMSKVPLMAVHIENTQKAWFYPKMVENANFGKNCRKRQF